MQVNEYNFARKGITDQSLRLSFVLHVETKHTDTPVFHDGNCRSYFLALCVTSVSVMEH